MAKKYIKLQDLDSDLGCGDNTGGIITVDYFFHKDVESWPKEPELDDSTTMEEYGKLKGDLVFKPGKCASRITLPPNKGAFNITEQGEMGGMSHQMELSIYQYGITAAMLGMMGATKNAKMGFVVTDANKNRYLMGDEHTGAFRDKGDGANAGSARTDLVGTGLKFLYPVNNPRQYTGDMESILIPTPAPGG